MHFRDRGIYCLPNGRELVALSNGENGRVRYRLAGTGCADASDYEVGDDGRLFCGGRLTAWDVRDLSDTGRTHY
jgi:hypothetical protein